MEAVEAAALAAGRHRGILPRRSQGHTEEGARIAGPLEEGPPGGGEGAEGGRLAVHLGRVAVHLAVHLARNGWNARATPRGSSARNHAILETVSNGETRPFCPSHG
jgi:hypothetical protein